MLVPLVPASLACNQQTHVRTEGQGLRRGRDAMLHLKREACGMTVCSLQKKKRKNGSWKAGRRVFCVLT
jgi:hypothetical protein